MILVNKEMKTVTKATMIANQATPSIEIGENQVTHVKLGKWGNYIVEIRKGKDPDRDLIYTLIRTMGGVYSMENPNGYVYLINVTIKSPTADDIRNNNANTQRDLNYYKGFGLNDARAIYTFLNILGLRGLFYQVGMIPEENNKVIVGKLS